jgi:hypothetical protein
MSKMARACARQWRSSNLLPSFAIGGLSGRDHKGHVFPDTRSLSNFFPNENLAADERRIIGAGRLAPQSSAILTGPITIDTSQL